MSSRRERIVRRSLVVAGAALAPLMAATSCGAVRDLPRAVRRPPVVHDGVPSEPLPNHRHSELCGHYYYEFQWYFVKDHRHGEACGHVWRHGRWTLE